jgi:hypothetical protein
LRGAIQDQLLRQARAANAPAQTRAGTAPR